MNIETSPTRPLWRTALAIALILIPLLMASAKLFHGPGWLHAGTSLEALPRHLRRHVEYLLFVPLSTVVVAFFRLTLGIRVLSLFRPVLIAIAFQRTGIPLGLTFLVVALATVAIVRAPLKRPHYYARVSVTAVLVVGMMVAALIAFKHWHAAWMMHLAYFPVIALCLTCESFATALDKSGLAAALWRAIATIAVGIVVMGLGRLPGFMALFVRCPELLLAQAGSVLLIADRFNYRLFESFNPLRARSQGPPLMEFRAPAPVQAVETNQ